MSIVNDDGFTECWFVYLLLIGMHASLAFSYGDDEFIMIDNDTSSSKKTIFDDSVQNTLVHVLICQYWSQYWCTVV